MVKTNLCVCYSILTRYHHILPRAFLKSKKKLGFFYENWVDTMLRLVCFLSVKSVSVVTKRHSVWSFFCLFVSFLLLTFDLTIYVRCSTELQWALIDRWQILILLQRQSTVGNKFWRGSAAFLAVMIWHCRCGCCHFKNLNKTTLTVLIG